MARPAAKIALFLFLAALAVVFYLFLLSALHSKLGYFSSAVPALLLAILTLILNWRFLRAERRSLADLGFDAPAVRIQQATLGFVAGAFTAGAWALAFWAVISVSWRMTPAFNSMAAAGSLTFIVFNNTAEELVYRGYLFLLMSEVYGPPVAIIGTSILFAFLHIQGGVPWQSVVAGVLTSGLLFAVLFNRWQSVPLVLAFHVATNVMQEIFGLRVSALTLVVPRQTVAMTALQSYAVLALVALINCIVALAVWLTTPNRPRAPAG